MKKLHPIVVIFFTFCKKVRVWKTIFLSTVNDFLYIVRNTSIKMINPEQAVRKKRRKRYTYFGKLLVSSSCVAMRYSTDTSIIPSKSFYSHMLKVS